MQQTSMNSPVPMNATRKVFGRRSQGFSMVLFGATLWGLSGTAAQQLFQMDGFSPTWLVTVRMTLSGIVLLLMVGLKSGVKSVFSVWGNKTDRIHLVVFSVLGLLAVQYSYFASIGYGNAATATFLQYLGPALIVIYLAIRNWRLPSGREATALGFAILGTFLLVTNGSYNTVVVPAPAIVWGLLSAAALAFYTLYPPALIARWGSGIVVGWAMLIGGLVFWSIAPPWKTSGQHWSWASLGLVLFVVLFGTLLAFYLYLNSLHFVSPTEASLLACAEPLSAAAAAVVLLNVHLCFATVLGGLAIVATVILLTLRPKTKNEPRK